MSCRRLVRAALPLLSAVAIGGVSGCRNSTSPRPTTIPNGLVQRTVVPGRVNVCTVGPVGDYAYDITTSGGVTGGSLPLGPRATIAAGSCADVWIATPTTRNPDPGTLVTVKPVSLVSGASFNRVVSAETEDEGYTLENDRASFVSNVYHGGASTFYFVAR